MQRVGHRRDATLEMAGAGDFFKGRPGMGLHETAHFLLLFRGNRALAADAEVKVVENAQMPALAQQFLDEAERNAESLCNLPLGLVVLVARIQDAQSKVE